MTALPIPPDCHSVPEAHSEHAAGESSTSSQPGIDTRTSAAAGVSEPQPPTIGSAASVQALSGVALTIYADALDDLERSRIATQNRVRALVQVKGMDGTKEHARMQGIVDALALLEHQSALLLQGAMRKHPLGEWVKNTNGIGLKQGARLLAAIGDPYWHVREDRPRTVSELWAYCGYHVVQPLRDTHNNSDGVVPSDGAGPGHKKSGTHRPLAGVAPSRRKGQQANWNTTARMRAFLVAESCMKQRESPYRAVYDAGRAKYAECDISDGHKHARALRLVAKAVLRDLWLESKRLHEETQ